ncbi:hypothetical protein ABVT39_026774 [Epinephelus coioides]
MLATPHQSIEPSKAEMAEKTDASPSSAAPVGVGCDTWLRDSEDNVSSVSAPVVVHPQWLTKTVAEEGLMVTEKIYLIEIDASGIVESGKTAYTSRSSLGPCPTLDSPGGYPRVFRHEFHHVSARLGVKYFHHADRFPLNNRKLWCCDGVHPSDDMGMPILMESLLAGTKQHLEIPAPKPQVSRLVSPKPLPKVVPRVIVVGEVVVPRAPLLSGRLYSWAGRGTTLNMSMALVHHRDEWFIMWYAIFHLTMIFT